MSTKHKPEISHKSTEMMTKSGKNKVPIHERFEKLMARKERKMKLL